MELNIGEHYIVSIFGLNVNLDTMITLWLSMLLILLFSLLAVVRINVVPSKMQSIFEKIVTIFSGLTKNLGKEQGSSGLILMCIFLLIIVSNLIGQAPLKVFHLPAGELASPTNDLNMTAALAIFITVYYIYKGVKAKGLSYFKHYIEPVWFMAPFNIMEDFIRPLTLSLRLFANILAGEILVMVLGILVASLMTPGATLGFIHHGTIGYNIGLFIGSLFPLPVMFFELFVAFIQALVFTLLSAAYINGAASRAH